MSPSVCDYILFTIATGFFIFLCYTCYFCVCVVWSLQMCLQYISVCDAFSCSLLEPVIHCTQVQEVHILSQFMLKVIQQVYLMKSGMSVSKGLSVSKNIAAELLTGAVWIQKLTEIFRKKHFILLFFLLCST